MTARRCACASASRKNTPRPSPNQPQIPAGRPACRRRWWCCQPDPRDIPGIIAIAGNPVDLDERMLNRRILVYRTP